MSALPQKRPFAALPRNDAMGQARRFALQKERAFDHSESAAR